MEASQQAATQKMEASQQAATQKMEAFITEALGGLSTRVEAVESSVLALQLEVASINGRINHIKGETSIPTHFDAVTPSLIAAERIAFAKVLVIIKGALVTNQLELHQFLTKLFNVLLY
jgi:hypothetical protein